MPLVPNRPTEQGRKLGDQVARLANIAEACQVANYPNERKRCKTCAFRSGTIPNGCESTVLDAIKCVVERIPFVCHEKPAQESSSTFCAGWLMAVAETQGMIPQVMPWDFSRGVD